MFLLVRVARLQYQGSILLRFEYTTPVIPQSWQLADDDVHVHMVQTEWREGISNTKFYIRTCRG